MVGALPLPADVGRLGCRTAAAAAVLRVGAATGAGAAQRRRCRRPSAHGCRSSGWRPAADAVPATSGWSARRPPRRASAPRRRPAAAAAAAATAATRTRRRRALLDVVGRLVERARTAGELRADVTVADVLLVIATAAPTLPDPASRQAASARLLEILLEGLRSRPAR